MRGSIEGAHGPNNLPMLSSPVAFTQALGGFSVPPPDPALPGLAGDSCLHMNLPAHEYHADRDALSCSLLKPLLISPAHFQAGLVAASRSSRAMDFGTLVHLLFLQHRAAAQDLAVYPGVADRSSAFADFEAAHCDRLVVDEPTFARGRRVAEKLASTKYKGRPLQRFMEESVTEATIYFTEPVTRLRMRVRIDSYHPEITFDLKSTRHASMRAFARDAVDMDYDLQAYMYSLARCMYEGRTTAPPFVFIAAESSAPHSVSTLEAGENFMGNGALKFKACAAAFKACTDTGLWPDLGTDSVLELEPWQQFSASSGWQTGLATAP